MERFFNKLAAEQRAVLTTVKAEAEKSTHGLRGESIATCLDNWLLDDEQREVLGLNPWNIYFLHAAAYLLEISSSPGDRIMKQWSALGLEDKTQAHVVSRVCDLAVNGDEASTGLTGTEKLDYKGAPINIALLAVALKLAAALDLAHQNTARVIAAALPASGRITAEQFYNSYTVTFLGPHASMPGTIQTRVRCHHPEVHRALKHHESRVQKLLHHANGQVSPRFLFSDIIYEIEPVGYTPLDMKFSVDSTAALQLFMGNRLYADKRVFLRELIQNAVDACNLKKLFDDDYQPEISVAFNDSISIIKFRDNGIGMDRQWIEKYFLKIGISFYQSGDIKAINRNRIDFNFISQFGIGFLSSFLVSDKIVIKTRKNGSPGLIITITNLQDYFDVRFAPEDCATGTEVTLYLKESKINYCRSLEYIGYLKINIRYLNIPVTLRDHAGRTIILGQSRLVYAIDERAGRDFVALLDFQDSKGCLYLKTRRDVDHIHGLEPAKGGISIFQDGIFVTQTDALLPEGARQNVIGRINLTGRDKCELSMDRNRIFWTGRQLQNIKRAIRMGMVDLANRVLTAALTLDPPEHTARSLINHLAIFFDFNEIDDEMYRCLGQPVREIVAKRFRDFVRINFAHTLKKSHVPDADGYSEKWQQAILVSFANRGRPTLPLN
ncbi:MAG: hypothetical protein GY697_10930 [Desulfobacterales bacterium]|nr:hypothetical protein [Desulfobacterales bacterium]